MVTKFGAERIIIGADVKDQKIAIHGWQETADQDVYEFIDAYRKANATHFLCTDVSKDGKLQGPSIELYKSIQNRFTDINVIASGGVASIQDVKDLKAIKCISVIIGKAIYEQKITLEELVEIDEG